MITDEPQVEIRLLAKCYGCKTWHPVTTTPAGFLAEMGDWQHKHRHPTCRIEFSSPKRKTRRGVNDNHFNSVGRGPWWLGGHPDGWKENANIKLVYAASAAYTITLASLATSSTWVAGRESTAVTNASNLYLDTGVGGKITTGTTPTVDTTIRVYCVGACNDTPLWPDVFDGTDSAETVTNTQMLASLPLLAEVSVSATSDLAYPINFMGIASLFGGLLPIQHVLFVAHNTAVNLNSTGGNHVLSSTGAYVTST